MALSTHTNVTVDLTCDNVDCAKSENLPQEAIKGSRWLLYRKGCSENLFLYEKLEKINESRALSTSVRMPAEKRATFCSLACADKVMKQELDKFLHKQIVVQGDRRRLESRY